MAFTVLAFTVLVLIKPGKEPNYKVLTLTGPKYQTIHASLHAQNLIPAEGSWRERQHYQRHQRQVLSKVKEKKPGFENISIQKGLS
jgi:hypothetical protein